MRIRAEVGANRTAAAAASQGGQPRWLPAVARTPPHAQSQGRCGPARAGSFVTFIGKAFGPASALTTAVIATTGYLIAISATMVVSAGFCTTVIHKYLGFKPPWQATMVFVVGVVALLLLRGVRVSTRAAKVLVLLEMTVMLIASVAILIDRGSSLSVKAFSPSQLMHGVHGFGIGFALAIFAYLGWEAAASMAEETDDPRRNVPRAVYAGIVLLTFVYGLAAYATVAGVGDSAHLLASEQIPFISGLDHAASGLVPVVYIAGISSTFAVLIAACNYQSRLMFSAAREGILPSTLARVSTRKRVPWASLGMFVAVAFAGGYAFGWNDDPSVFFAEAATLGTTMVALVYTAVNIALPVYMRRRQPGSFSTWRHGVLPTAGVVAIAYPLWTLFKPGQPGPYDLYPWITLGLVVACAVYGVVLSHRYPDLGNRIGSIVADAEDDGLV